MQSATSPGMTRRQKELVRESWARSAAAADELAQAFYGRLFELDPALRRLFPADMTAQRRKLIATIGTAVDGLFDFPAVVPILETLGRRHVGYGVRDGDYATVGAALLWALREQLGDGFSAEAEEAWGALYALLADVMIGAAKAVGGPPPEAPRP